MSSSNGRVIALMQDLMFMVRIQDAVKSAELEFLVTKTRAEALRLASAPTAMFILDLNYESGEPIELIRDLKANSATKNVYLLAYVAHIQVDKKAEALDAGCDVVLARSALFDKLPALLQGIATSTSH